MTFFEISYAERRISWFNINPLSSIHRNDARWIINRFSPLRFCLCLWSGCKNLQLWRLFFKQIFRTFCVVVVWIDHKFSWSMRNSDPRLKLSLLRDQILISTPCLPYRQLVVTSSTGPISCFPESILSTVMINHFLEECIHDKPLHKIVLHYLFSWNTVQFQQHLEILHPKNFTYSVSVWKTFDSFFISLQ